MTQRLEVPFPTDGQWSWEERNTYFLASSPHRLRVVTDQKVKEGNESPPLFLLVAVNDVNPDNETDVATMNEMLDSGARVLMDSGVFWLTNRHKREHGITMDKALSLHPEEIDDFEWLWDRYLKLHAMFGDRLWGTIELDQGGASRKIETRGRLHDLGINPIPVYHPLNDGWDYFDELAENYDRICFGNVVQANSQTRQRLLMTAYERKQKYPHLWIHLLGYSQNDWLYACPVESCDSSAWLSIIRWASGAKDRSMLKQYGTFPIGMRYDFDVAADQPSGSYKSVVMSAQMWRANHLNWTTHLDNLEEVFGHDEFR